MTMSKKQTKKTKATKNTSSTAQAKGTKTRGAAKQATASVAERGETEAAASRLPPVGTVIKKLDRYGNVRCQCTVTESGIRYKSQNFRSLSGAAMAAAKDLELTNKTQNGFTFWGLSKPERKLDDPEAALNKASERFQKLAAIAIKGATSENRAKVRAAIEGHGQVVESLLGEAAQ
jgi:hypothetical protein